MYESHNRQTMWLHPFLMPIHYYIIKCREKKLKIISMEWKEAAKISIEKLYRFGEIDKMCIQNAQ